VAGPSAPDGPASAEVPRPGNAPRRGGIRGRIGRVLATLGRIPHPSLHTRRGRFVAALLVSACGGGDPYVPGSGSPSGAPTTPGSFTSVVSFGDSLSDLGAYTPATSFNGNGLPPYLGGKFTTNIDGGAGLVWVENVANAVLPSGATGAPTITPAEVVPALQRGVVDGAFTAAVPALDWKFNELGKMGYMINLTLAHQVMAVNEQAQAKLPADLRQLLNDKSKEWTQKYRLALIDADKTARKTLADKGVTLLEVSSQDMDKLRSVTRPMWSEWSEKNGPLAQRMLTAAADSCR